MPTVGQHIAQMRAQGVPDPEARAAARLGITVEQLTPQILAVDVSMLGPVFSNPLTKLQAAPPPQAAAPAPQQPPQRKQVPMGDLAMGQGRGLGEVGEVKLNRVFPLQRALNAAVLAPTGVLPYIAGQTYGAAKEVGRGFAYLAGQDENYRKALASLPGPLRESESESPVPEREREAYREMIQNRTFDDWLEATTKSAVDLARVVAAPILEMGGVSPTGYEHLPLAEQFLPNAAMRFQRGRQFGEGAVVGPGVQAAQFYETPAPTIAGDPAGTLALAASAVGMGKSAANLARARLASRTARGGLGAENPLPRGYVGPRDPHIAPIDAGPMVASDLALGESEVGRVGTQTRSSPEAIAKAKERVSGLQEGVTTPPVPHGPLDVARVLAERAGGMMTRSALTTGIAGSTGAPPGVAVALGAAAGAIPEAMHFIGKLKAYRDAQVRGTGLMSKIPDPSRVAQSWVGKTQHIHPEGQQYLVDTIVEPQRARSAVEAETQFAMNRARGEQPSPNVNARGEQPVYDVVHRQMAEDGTVAERPARPEGYAEGSQAASSAAIETASLEGQRELLTPAIGRTKQSLKRADERLSEFDYVDVEDAKRRLAEVNASIDKTREVASEMGKVERQRERIDSMRDQAERKKVATVENLGKATEKVDERIAAAESKHQGVLLDLESRRQQLTQTLKDQTAKADEILASDPAANQKNKRGQRLSANQKAWREATAEAEVAEKRLAGIEPAIARAREGFERQQSFLEDQRRQAVESEAMRASEAENRYRESIDKIEAVLAKAEAELAARIETLPPELQREGANFKEWLNERYKRRSELRGMIRLEDVRKRSAFLEEQLNDFTAKREEVYTRLKQIEKERREGKIPSSSEALSRTAGAVEQQPRTFIYKGKPQFYIDAEGNQRPVSRWLPLNDVEVNRSVERLYNHANDSRAPGAPVIPREYFGRFVMDAMFDDSPFLAGSKAIRGAVAKKVAKALGFEKGKMSKRRRMIEEAVQRELNETAKSALGQGGSGKRPVWSTIEIDGQVFNLRELSAEAAHEFSQRNVKWWQGGKGTTVRDIAVRQAAERAAKSLGLKVEESKLVRQIYNEAHREIPATAVTPYDKAAHVFADYAANGNRPRAAVGFDAGPVAKQILADPQAFAARAEAITGKRIGSLDNPAAHIASDFAYELGQYEPASVDLRAIMQKGEQEAAIPSAANIYVHRSFSLPINDHANSLNLMQRTSGIAKSIHDVSQHAKGMWTYGRPKTFIGNVFSNVVVPTIMDPTYPATVLPGLKASAQRWGRWVREGKVEGQPIKVGSVQITPGDMMRALADTGAVDTSMIADLARHFGQGESSIGEVSSTLKAANDIARRSYIAADSLPKILETERYAARVLHTVDGLTEGRYVTLDLGDRQAIALKKVNGTIVDGSTGVPLTPEQIARYSAKAAFQTPKSYLFDFNDLPVALSVMGRFPIISIIQPFMSWMWKATDIPGIKPGIGTAMLKYDPTFILKTNDPKLHAQRVAEMGKLMAKRAMLLGAARSLYDFGDIEGTYEAMGGRSIPPAVMVYTTDTDVEDAVSPFYNAFALGPTIGAFRAGSAAVGAMLGNGWEERLTAGYDPSLLTPSERRKRKAVRRWWANWNTGRAGGISDVLAMIGANAAMAGDVVEYAEKQRRAGKPMEWSEPLMAILTMTAAGGVMDVSRVLSSLGTSDSEFSGWRNVQNAQGQQVGATSRVGKEDWLRYAARAVFGLAVQTNSGVILQGDQLAKFSSTFVSNVINARTKQAVANLMKARSMTQQQVVGMQNVLDKLREISNYESIAKQPGNKTDQASVGRIKRDLVAIREQLAKLKEFAGTDTAALEFIGHIEDIERASLIVADELTERSNRFLRGLRRRKYLEGREKIRRARAEGRPEP